MPSAIVQQPGNPLVSLTEHRLSCAVEDELIVLNVNTGWFYNLNSTGAVIWEFLHQPRRVHEICEWVRSHYGCTAPDLDTDVTQFLGEMQSVGLIALTQMAGEQR